MSDLKNVFIPIEDLPYEVKNLFKPDCEMKTIEEGIVTGYAATFHKKPDLGGDVILPGAFAKTIKNGGVNGNGIKFLWQHIHTRPIGVPLEMVEDKRGLRTKSQLAMKSADGHDAFAFAELGALDGFSIGYKIDDFRETEKIRQLIELGLYEYSFVTFAMNPRAGITSIKTAIQTAKTPRQLELALRDSGLSRKAAMYIVKLCKPNLRLAGEGNLQDLLKTIKSVNADMLLTRMINSVGDRKDVCNDFEEKPFPNEHACRLIDPGQFDRFRRQNNAAQHNGKRIDFIFGIKAGKSKLQAMRYPKSIWTAASARSHCKSKEGTFEQASGKFVCEFE